MGLQTHCIFEELIAPKLVALDLICNSDGWKSLSGGRTNQLWHVPRPQGDIVVKLFSERDKNPLFPNNPDQEAQVLDHLGAHKMAPHILTRFDVPAGRCLVYGHLAGAPWQSGTAQVAKLLHRVHMTPPPPGLRRVASGSDEIRQQTRLILNAVTSERKSTLLNLEPTHHVPPSAHRVFLHGDPVPANIIQNGSTLRLIDWQCPAIGDPCEDIAVFASPAMQLAYRGAVLTEAEMSDFENAYPNEDTIRRYTQMAPWYHWRMAAYCLWKDGIGDPKAAHAFEAEIEHLKACA